MVKGEWMSRGIQNPGVRIQNREERCAYWSRDACHAGVREGGHSPRSLSPDRKLVLNSSTTPVRQSNGWTKLSSFLGNNRKNDLKTAGRRFHAKTRTPRSCEFCILQPSTINHFFLGGSGDRQLGNILAAGSMVGNVLDLVAAATPVVDIEEAGEHGRGDLHPGGRQAVDNGSGNNQPPFAGGDAVGSTLYRRDRACQFFQPGEIGIGVRVGGAAHFERGLQMVADGGAFREPEQAAGSGIGQLEATRSRCFSSGHARNGGGDRNHHAAGGAAGSAVHDFTARAIW